MLKGREEVVFWWEKKCFVGEKEVGGVKGGGMGWKVGDWGREKSRKEKCDVDGEKKREKEGEKGEE